MSEYIVWVTQKKMSQLTKKKRDIWDLFGHRAEKKIVFRRTLYSESEEIIITVRIIVSSPAYCDAAANVSQSVAISSELQRARYSTPTTASRQHIRDNLQSFSHSLSFTYLYFLISQRYARRYMYAAAHFQDIYSYSIPSECWALSSTEKKKQHWNLIRISPISSLYLFCIISSHCRIRNINQKRAR